MYIIKVRVPWKKKKIKVEVTPHPGCSCHPETCNHWKYDFRYKNITWSSDYESDYWEVLYRANPTQQ